jgi:photosystem II stability/assembly factor-like uncharacterized protein
MLELAGFETPKARHRPCNLVQRMRAHRIGVFVAAVALAGCAEIDDEEGELETVEQRVDAIGPPGSSQKVPVPRGSAWEYRDWGIDQGTSWRIADGSWVQGRGPFGYGESYLATTVSYGNDPGHKHPTTYFRKQFYAGGTPAKMFLRVMYDDGFVFYINGKEGGRAAMPSGAVTFSTLSTGFETGNRYVTFDISSQIPNLHSSSVNTLAFEVHQSSASSSDLAFDAELITWIPSSQTGTVTYSQGIPRGAEWKLWDQGGDLGTEWRGVSYSDSAWSGGPAPFGFGEAYVVTETRRPPITTYFRGRFEVDEDAVTEMFADVRFDDGFVAYLNGHEIARRSMPGGAITASTLAVGHEALAYERLDWSSAIQYLDWSNVLTIEVHQSSASSSDLVFDLSLQIGDGRWTAQASGTQAKLNGVWFTDADRGWAVGDDGTLIRTTDGGAHWTPQAHPAVEDLEAIQFVDAMHGKIVGAAGMILETSDGGETWDGGSFTTEFTGLWFLTPEHGWIAAQSDLVYHTEDGFSYDPQDVGSGGRFHDVHFLDEDTGWIVGHVPVPGDNHAAIYKTADGGASWHQQWTSGVHHYYLWDVEVVDAETVWAVGHGSLSLVHEKKLVTRDGGLTWNEAPETENELAVYGIEFVGPLTGWAVGAFGSIVHTRDGGLSWEIQGEAQHYMKPTLYDVHFTDQQQGWAVGELGRILHTSTGGE